MEKMKWTWKKIVGTILGILGIGTLTSCYGVMTVDRTKKFSVNGLVCGDIDGDGNYESISGIEVTLQCDPTEAPIKTETFSGYDYDHYYKSNGIFSFSEVLEDDYAYSFKLTFRDIDGEKNGSFKTATYSKPIVINESHNTINVGTIYLERKENP